MASTYIGTIITHNTSYGIVWPNINWIQGVLKPIWWEPDNDIDRMWLLEYQQFSETHFQSFILKSK